MKQFWIFRKYFKFYFEIFAKGTSQLFFIWTHKKKCGENFFPKILGNTDLEIKKNNCSLKEGEKK